MNKIFLTLLLGILLIGNVLALDSLENQRAGKQGENYTISQVCSDSTFITISSIQPPTGSPIILNTNMTSIGSGEFQYNFTNTMLLGDYEVRGISDGCEKTFSIRFEITPSGRNGNEVIWFSIFLIIFIYGLTLLGFFKENSVILILGGMFMIFLSVYLINNGIIIYRDDITRYFSYLTFGLGVFFSLLGGNWLYNDL
jgi:hypothetical protein